MPSYAVRFKGMLLGTHRERLEEAGIVLESREPGMKFGPIKTGVPINTVRLEADSAEQALARLKELLAPDDVNFSNWEAEGR
jgi:hypothetical protein